MRRAPYPSSSSTISISGWLQKLVCPTEDRVEHRHRELARVRVLAARMVRRDDDDGARAVCRDELRAMREDGPARVERERSLAQQLENCTEGDRAERNDDAQALQGIELFDEIRKTVAQLRR